MTTFSIEAAEQRLQIIFDDNQRAEKLHNILTAHKNRSAPTAVNRFNYVSAANENRLTITGEMNQIISVLNRVATAVFPNSEERLITNELINQIEASCIQLGMRINHNRLFANQAQPLTPSTIDSPTTSNLQKS